MGFVILLVLFVGLLGHAYWEVHSPPFIQRNRDGKYRVLKRGGLGGWHCLAPSGSLWWIGNPSTGREYLFDSREAAQKAIDNYKRDLAPQNWKT